MKDRTSTSKLICCCVSCTVARHFTTGGQLTIWFKYIRWLFRTQPAPQPADFEHALVATLLRTVLYLQPKCYVWCICAVQIIFVSPWSGHARRRELISCSEDVLCTHGSWRCNHWMWNWCLCREDAHLSKFAWLVSIAGVNATAPAHLRLGDLYKSHND